MRLPECRRCPSPLPARPSPSAATRSPWKTRSTSLFAPVDESELAEVRADWAARDLSPAAGTVELEEAYSLGGTPTTIRIVSHLVDGARHYGAIVAPRGAGAERLPILVFAHGGDTGVSVENTLFIPTFILGELRDDFVYVIPSFRDEPLEYGDRIWRSEGPASPWDRDVDDALSLVNLAMETTPEANSDRYFVVGFSRGGGVAMLMGARDPRIEGIITFFGPTDFRDDWARDIARLLVTGLTVDLPGVEYLRTEYVRAVVGRGPFDSGCPARAHTAVCRPLRPGPARAGRSITAIWTGRSPSPRPNR